MSEKILAIIGGGASGMAAAIEAARMLKKSNTSARVIIYEQLSKIGKKILATGNGRCNILNVNATADDYNGNKKFISAVFGSFSINSNIDFFKSMGIYFSREDDGRFYPMSFQASSVLDALRFEIDMLGIEVVCDVKIVSVKKSDGKFILNDSIVADAVIFAGGGKSSPSQGSDGSCYPLLNSLGIKSKTVYPALTGIVLKKKNKGLKGVRAAGEILVVDNGTVIAASEGELQYTDYGISGIPAMDVSAKVSEHFAKKKKGKIFIAVNSLPNFAPEDIYNYIKERKKHNSGLLCEDLLSGLMPKKLGVAKINSAGISPQNTVSTLTNNDIAALTEVVNSEIYEVGGTLGFENSQVTAGGIDTKQFTTELECSFINALFICGEILDVDARCGGFNLSWAWSSGRCAGHNAAVRMTQL